MAAAKNSAVPSCYEVPDIDNRLLDKMEEPIVHLHGGYGGIFPLVEGALRGGEINDTVDMVLSPNNTFDEYDPGLVRVEDVSVSPAEVEMEMMFEADGPVTDGVIIYRVTDVASGKAVINDNHPLAGMKVCFKATVNNIRDVADKGITHGHIRGPHGHHH